MPVPFDFQYSDCAYNILMLLAWLNMLEYNLSTLNISLFFMVLY